jgi:hypothetical protein
MSVLGLGKFAGYVPWQQEDSLVDHEAVVLDFEGLYDFAAKRSGGEWPDTPIVLNGGQFAEANALITRRTAEVREFLALGRLVAVHLPRKMSEVKQPGDNEWAPLWDLVLSRPWRFRPGAGRELRLSPSAPASLRNFWQGVQSLNPRYRSRVEGEQLGCFLFAGETDVPVGILCSHGGGHIITLPDMDGGLEKLAPLVSDLYRAIRGSAPDDDGPAWAVDYRLPNENKTLERVQMKQSAVASAEAELQAATDQLRIIERQKLLFHGSGESLRLEVATAFEALGFKVDRADKLRWDLALEDGDQHAVVEVKGVVGSAREAHAAELEKWTATFYAERMVVPKGILVTVTYRERPPDQRSEADYPDQMLAYSQMKQLCLMTGMDLLRLVHRVRSAQMTAVDARGLLFETVGVFPGREWESVLERAQPA